MRIISQDGRSDIPYDEVNVNISTIDEKEVIAWRFGCPDDEVVLMGRYTTVDKALRAMEMLREEYLETVYDYRTRPKVFIFPKDEEIEV